MQLITFVIPIRHHENAPNWDGTMNNLRQTIKSIQGQSENDWRCIIVANKGAKLIDLPDGFEACLVEFPPNKLHLQGGNSEGDFLEAITIDKGSRVLAGLLYAKKLNYFMVVDDDDFIHCDLVKFAKNNSADNGWYFDKGYIWGDGGRFILKYLNFYLCCGTSHIVKASLITLPNTFDNIDIQYTKDMFGSHIKIKNALDIMGTPLAPLPFYGAIYRIGHSDAHSKSPGLFRRFFYKKVLFKKPNKLIVNFLSLRLINKRIKAEFFGENDF
ncbi:MAG: hypothetical protein OCD00_09930 [Colwellia sp.]